MPNILPEDFLSTSEARESLARIEGLIERVKEAAASPNNKGRGQRHPNVSFGIEEPMTWVRLWNLDTPRYYSDPLYYVEMTLRQKLWICTFRLKEFQRFRRTTLSPGTQTLAC
jgi:hypothetical protein